MHRCKCDADWEVCWSGPTHIEILSRMPVEVLCRRFRGSLVCDGCTRAVQRQAHTFRKMFYTDDADCIRCLFLQKDCALLGRARHPLPRAPTDRKQSASSRGKSIMPRIFLCVRKFFSSGGTRHPACPVSRPCMGSAFFPCVFLAAAFFFRFVPFPRKVLYNESRYIKISIKEGFS